MVEAVLFVVSVVVFCLGMAALAWRRLERGNRVSPSVHSNVPLHWRSSYRAAPRMHRHLQRTVAGVRTCLQQDEDLGLADLVGELERAACAIDDQLAIAGRMPQPTRRRLLRELKAETGELDRMAERVVRLRRAWSGAVPSARSLAPVAERIDALEAALRDVARLDRVSGLDGGLGHLDQPVEGRRRLALGD
jgi:hypothetical protein